MSRLTNRLFVVLGPVLVACQADGGQADGGPGRVVLQNEPQALAGSLVMRDEVVAVRAAASLPNALIGAQNLDYSLTLVAEVSPPVVDGVTLQATSVAFAGDIVVVGYNVAGEDAKGGVDVFLIDAQRLPHLVSRATFDDTDVHAVAADTTRVALATATSDEFFAAPAVLEMLSLDEAGHLGLDGHQRTPLPSFAATSVAFVGDRIAATSGDRGGVSLVGADGALRARSELADARWVAVPDGGPVVAVRGTPGTLVVYDPETLAERASFPFEGADVPESKSTLEVLGQRAFIAAGPTGALVLDIDSGAELGRIPVAGGASADAVTNAVSAYGELVFISNGAGGVALAVADRDLGAPDPAGSDPIPSFVTAGRLVFPEDDGGSVNHVSYRDGVLFVATGRRGLRIVRVDAVAPVVPPALVSLSPSVGVLVPDFDPATTDYRVDVGPTVEAVAFSASADGPIRVAGASLESGGTSAPIALAPGPQTIEITVGEPVAVTYRVEVVRDPTDVTPPEPPALTAPADGKATTSRSPLALVGTCTAGLEVRLSGAAEATVACSDGTFALEVQATSDGTWSYDLVQIKPSGATSSPVPVHWTFDRAAPPLPTILSPATSPFYTPGNLVTLTGVCEDGAEVRLGGDAIELAPCVDRRFGFDLVALDNGSREYTLEQRDVAGNSSERATLIVVRDDTTPAVPLFTSPAPGSYASSDASMRLAGHCDGEVIVHLTGAATASIPCDSDAFAFDVAASEGRHLYQVHAESARTGLRSGSDTFTWIADRTAPMAPTVAVPADGDATSAGSSLTIAGACEPGATVLLDGDITASTSCDGTFSFVVTATADGRYTFQVSERDPAGNVSAASEVGWTRDSSVPITPVITSHPSPWYSVETSIVIAGACITGHRITLTGDDDATMVCAAGAFSFHVTRVAEGSARFLVYQTRLATGVESAEAVFEWVRDSVPPAPIELLAPAANPFISGDDAFALVGTCEEGASLELDGDARAVVACADGTFNITIAASDDGERSYTLVQRDRAGNASSPVLFRWVRTTAIPPTPTLVAPADTPHLSNGAMLALAGACESGNDVELSGDASEAATCVGGAFTFEVAGPTDGTRSYRIVQRSASNGFASAEAVVIWMRDTDPPPAPAVLTPATSPWTTGDADLTVAGSCESGAVVSLEQSPGGALTVPCVDDAFTFAVHAPDNGTYTLALSQRDRAGNDSGVRAIVWESDDTVPAQPVITSPLVSPFASSQSTLTLFGTCTSGFVVDLKGASTQRTTCVDDAFTFAFAEAIDGTYDFLLEQVNPRTRLASAATAFTWRRDTVRPDEPIVTSPLASPYWSGNDRLVIAGECEDAARIRMSGAESGETTCDGGRFAFELLRTADATYNFELDAVDAAGNVSLPILFQWVRDASLPPTPLITSPSSPHFSRGASLELRGTCESGFEVVLQGAADATTGCASGTFVFPLQAAGEGTWNYRVHQVRPLTGIASSDASVVWTYDATAPARVELTAPASNPYGSGDTTFTLAGRCEGDARVSLSGAQSSSANCAEGAFRFDIAATTNGRHAYSLVQTDRAGNASPTLAFDWVRDDSLPPTPLLSSPPSSSWVSNGSTITLAGSCHGANTVTVSGAGIASATCSGGAFSFTFGESADGTYGYAVAQTSAINGSASSAAVVSWTRDTVPPGAPTLSDITPESPSAQPNPRATGVAPGAALVQLFRSADCTGAVAASGTASGFAGSGIALPALVRQTMSVSARALDTAGNASPCADASFAYRHRAPEMVKDINVSGNGASSPTAFGQVGTRLFFRANNGIVGSELFVSDGTAAGTRLVADINVADSSNVANVVDFNGVAFFAANDGTRGAELWRSDGTSQGTQLVADINPGANSSSPATFFAVGSTLYFTADDGTDGIELWKTDGTTEGTVQVADLEPGSGNSSPTQLRAVGSVVVFRATTTVAGVELWKTDGTTTGTTVFDINPGAANGSPNYLVNWNGGVYFSATTAAHGSELWKTDGATVMRVTDLYVGTGGSAPSYLSVAGSTLFLSARKNPGNIGYELFKVTVQSGVEVVELVKDIYPGGTASSSSPTYITALGSNRVVFRATTAAHGQELWASDGTDAGTVLLADMNPGSANSAMTAPVAVAGQAYLTATTSAEIELWKTDGTVAGTSREDVNPGPNASAPSALTVFGAGVVGSFQSNTWGREPFFVDPSGARLLADVNAFPSSSPSALAVLNGAVYFAADDGVHGKELWKTDGTASGTVLVKDIAPGIDQSTPAGLTVVGDMLFFTADDGSHGIELWRSDGTEAGTALVGDLCAGLMTSAPASLIALGNQLLFAADDCTSGVELWQVSGAGAAAQLKDINVGNAGSAVTAVALLAGRVYFRATAAGYGAELWVSDGTAAGTLMVKDIRAGTSGSSPANLKVVGNRIFFSATEAATGTELYVSDGTTDGTYRVSDINPGTGSSSPSNLVDLGGLCVFSATEPTLGRELYTSSGAAADVRLLRDIYPGARNSSPGVPLVVGGKALFAATDDERGAEPWITDGTAAGTTRLADLNVGAAPSSPSGMVIIDDGVFFIANDGVNGSEPWRTDLTAHGTVLVQDLNRLGPGWGGALVVMGNEVFFAANDGSHGVELWRY